jgi:hypothetical protein
MEPCYATPGDLVRALSARAPEAREQLVAFLRPSLARLMAQLGIRHGRDVDRDRLTLYALHLAETWLRTLPPDKTRFLSWAAFRGTVLMQVAKLAAQPFTTTRDLVPGPLSLPDCDTWSSRILFLPHQRDGDLAFGGDWFGGGRASDGSFWVLLADTTGHGYSAHLLACALPAVWQHCWDRASHRAEPATLLSAMHALLEDSLPEGVYVEGTLVRLEPAGAVTVAPAGGTRLLLRRPSGQLDFIQLRGTWLGLQSPSAADQRSWQLEDGDELLLSTDGVFDQLADLGPRPAELLAEVHEGTLFEAVERLLRQALELAPQKDDITMILLRRQAPAAPGPVTLPFPGRRRHEAGDVSV